MRQSGIQFKLNQSHWIMMIFMMKYQ